MNHPSEFDQIFKPLDIPDALEMKRDHDREMVLDVDIQGKSCTRCGGVDTGEDGLVNMDDGKYGMCSICTDDMGAT
jgi:hypothetical protein